MARDEGSDGLSRRVRVVTDGREVIAIDTWLDQWGLWINGTGAPWTVAQEDGTESFLARFVAALEWLREWDGGYPRETRVTVTGDVASGTMTR